MTRHGIVPPHLVVEAMRDNGYKNAAYAIAELMDNSVQAGADLVELLCMEESVLVNQRNSKRLRQIAVLDNGLGMDSTVLRMALQFGNGTRLESGKEDGIGRFGMGLPASSISQCTTVNVWSWQEGIDSAIHTHLDVNEIKAGTMQMVPEPRLEPVPDVWQKVGKGFGESGTLVVWSNIDRCMWKSASAVVDNSELLIGRMYRKFLEQKCVSIRLVTFEIDSSGRVNSELKEKYAKPNDPGYLIDNTSCPAPWDQVAMFKPWGEQHERVHRISFRGGVHDVRVSYSVAKNEARSVDNAGATDYGRHARRNVGVSIVRAGREMDLDQGIVSGYDPRERWWGVEIEFPPSLDDLFGVTNNKQSARNLAEVFSKELESWQDGRRSLIEVIEELEQEGDPSGPLIRLLMDIDGNVKGMRDMIQAQTKGIRSTRRHTATGAEDTATQATQERQRAGFRGDSDEGESLPAGQRAELIKETLVEEGLPDELATALAAKTVSDNLKYVFTHSNLEGSAFFSVKPRGGTIVITLNTTHPAYNNLVDVLEQEVEGVPEGELRMRLDKALVGLKLLFMSWARYEDELRGEQKEQAQDTRADWGRVARQFLRENS